MDCMMPVMDGFEATLKIRQLAPRDQCTIVALSAMTHKEDVERCVRSGMDYFLNKPPLLEKLRHTLEAKFPG